MEEVFVRQRQDWQKALNLVEKQLAGFEQSNRDGNFFESQEGDFCLLIEAINVKCDLELKRFLLMYLLEVNE